MCIFTIIANGFQKTAQPYLLTEMDGNSYIYISLYLLYIKGFFSKLYKYGQCVTFLQFDLFFFHSKLTWFLKKWKATLVAFIFLQSNIEKDNYTYKNSKKNCNMLFFKETITTNCSSCILNSYSIPYQNLPIFLFCCYLMVPIYSGILINEFASLMYSHKIHVVVFWSYQSFFLLIND